MSNKKAFADFVHGAAIGQGDGIIDAVDGAYLERQALVTAEKIGVYDAFIGNPVFVRTCVHYYLGRLIYVDERDIVLTRATWVAVTSRWGALWATGKWEPEAEFEIFPPQIPVAVNRLTVADIMVWPHALPTQSQ